MKHYMNKKKIVSYEKIAWILIPLLIFFAEGCRPVKEMKPVTEIPHYETETIIKHLKSNQSEFDWFSARFTGNIILDDRHHDISGTIRIKKDEAIYVSLSPVLGIEIARAIITTDTVKFLNRLESSYYIGHIGFLNSMLRTSFDYDMLQALLIGNDFSNYSTGFFTSREDQGLIMLNDTARQSLHNTCEHNPVIFNQYLWIDPNNHKIRKNLITEKSAKSSIRAEYGSFRQIQGEELPTKLNLLIADPVYYADLSLQYLRISLNEPQQMNFNVPSRYEPIKFE